MTRRAALVSDVRGWAFDVNLRALAKHALGDWEVEYFYAIEMVAADWARLATFDAIFTPFHRWNIPPGVLPRERHLGSLRCEWFYPAHPSSPGPAEYGLVNRYVAFHVVTRTIFEQLQSHCPGVRYLTNPVDTALFHPSDDACNEFVCEWNGNASHAGNIKGLGILQAACQAAEVPLRTSEYTTKIANTEMPAFYRQASVALCGSLYEGHSNSVAEAMAMGLALVTTECGTAREMRASQFKHFGDTGIVLVDRSAAGFAAALEELKRAGMPRVRAMGELNALEISARWSWAVWAERYKAFFNEVRP
jgi:glycosyltransferase involved in cell wall biosynthesis